MRFARLDFRAFGSFDQAPPIEFGEARGLHLILGPNEAGKSTALRAIRRLLFGFPLQAGDNHRHAYDDLRVGGTLRDERGRELAFIRRKKRKVEDSVWAGDDSAMIDPASLGPFLGGVDEARFADLFSMDHAELIQGGRAILGGGGRIGELLFAAGSGLAGIDEVRKAIEAEADALFKPTGRNPAINAAINDLAALRAAAKRSMLATSDWVALDAQIARAGEERHRIEAELYRIEADKKRREAVAKALPILRQRGLELARLEPLRGVPVLAEGFVDLRRRASADRDLSGRVAADATAGLEKVAAELAEVGPADPILGDLDAIAQVQAGLGEYRKARRDRPGRVAKLARIEAEARALLLEFLPGLAVDQVAEARRVASRRASIQELAQQSGLIEAGFAQAARDVEGLAASLTQSAESATASDPARAAEALTDVVDRVAQAGKPEGRLAEARFAQLEAARQIEVEVRALRLWSGSLADLEALGVPSTLTIDRFTDDLRAADEAIAAAEAARARVQDEKLRLDREIEAVRRAGPPPTEADLTARRGDRDRTWREVRAAWLGEGDPIAPSPALAARFEVEARAADVMADRLRREADHVAEQSRREVDRLALVARMEEFDETLAGAVADRSRLLGEWQGLWQPLGVDPLPPREMRDWVALERPALVEKARSLRKLQVQETKAAEEVAGLQAELRNGLNALGEPIEDPAETLAGLLGRARRAVERVAQGRHLAEARSRLAKAGAERDAWRARWLAAVGPLGLDRDASTARASAIVDGVDRAIKVMEEHATLLGSIAEADRITRDWESEVRGVLDRLGIADDKAEAEAEAEAEDRARLLTHRLDEAREAKTRREGLLAREALERGRLDQAMAEADRASVTLAGLAREAKCASVDQLEDAERASSEVKEIKERLQALDERLSDLAGSGDLAAFLETAAASDPAANSAEIAELTDRLAPLEERRNQLLEESGGCAERLKRMDGGPLAAEAQQAVEERTSRLALDVEKYARLRLASAILREAVERHRQEHQGPVLDRAGGLFAALTLGSFAGLRAEVDDKGATILLGVRADGKGLHVDAMSEGTADQLYLSLRLASLHAHLEAKHEPIPLVVDDILVNFDDARALAALLALADLSSRTQVLFFTHHAHLVDLARSALPGDVLTVHHLAYPPVSRGPIASHDASVAEPPKPKRKKKAAPAGEAEFLR